MLCFEKWDQREAGADMKCVRRPADTNAMRAIPSTRSKNNRALYGFGYFYFGEGKGNRTGASQFIKLKEIKIWSISDFNELKTRRSGCRPVVNAAASRRERRAVASYAKQSLPLSSFVFVPFELHTFFLEPKVQSVWKWIDWKTP